MRMINYEIHTACLALERTIQQLKDAGERAKENGDRAAERNLGEYSVEDLQNLLKSLKAKAEYITQERWGKYFK